MQDIDLTDVDPRRWPEIRRRVAAIQAYIALGRGNGARRDEFAAQLGLNPMTFLALVKAWKEHGKASRLQGSGVLDRGKARPLRSLPQASRDAISASIEALGVDARHVDMLTDVYARCDAIGTKRPSTGMVQRLVMQRRREAPTRVGDPEVLIGRVVAKLPVLRGGRAVLPDLLVAVLSPEGIVVAHLLDGGTGETANIGSLLDRIDYAATPGSINRPLLAPKNLAETTEPASRQRLVRTPTSGRIARLLGSSIGRLEISHRRKRTTRAPDDGSPMNVSLGRSEAVDAIRVAIEAHNSARGGVPLFSVPMAEAGGTMRRPAPCVRQPEPEARR